MHSQSGKFLGDVCLQSEGVSEEKENHWPQKREVTAHAWQRSDKVGNHRS